MTDKTLAPTFTHDCDKCRLLGTVRDGEMGGRLTDLYVCDSEVETFELVARFSNTGSDYYSAAHCRVDAGREPSHRAVLRAAMSLAY